MSRYWTRRGSKNSSVSSPLEFRTRLSPSTARSNELNFCKYTRVLLVTEKGINKQNPTHRARQLLHDFSSLFFTGNIDCRGIKFWVANGLQETIAIPLALADAVLNNPLLPNGVRETCERGKGLATLQNKISSRRLLDTNIIACLSFQLLLPFDSLPLMRQGVGVWDNNRRGHARMNSPMMAD